MKSFCHTPRHTESVTKVHLANLGPCYTRFASLLNVQSRAQGLFWGSLTRFIPACAGNSRAENARGRVHPVHPRVCGEQQLGPGRSYLASGSSPRVRGTGLTGPQRMHGERVHPRVCGEQSFPVCNSKAMLGSSPRVRGTVESVMRFLRNLRFIPACAGNRVYI